MVAIVTCFTMNCRFVDASIAELLDAEPAFVDGFDCIVTCLDSGRDTYRVAVNILGATRVRRLGRYAVVDGRDAVAFRDALFNGFDELFVFPRDAWSMTDASAFAESFTSERCSLAEEIPAALLAIFELTKACKYVSDGVGLNIAIRGESEEANTIARRFR
jgi:hypothetical protein